MLLCENEVFLQEKNSSGVHVSKMKAHDFIVVGAGSAGLSLALELSKEGSVLVFGKGDWKSNNSWWAQGGIASVLGSDDSFDEHIKDTLDAGAGLCHLPIVEKVVKEAPSIISQLIDFGVGFTPKTSADKNQNDSADKINSEVDGENKKFPYHLTMEGGHSKRRVIHAADATGQALMSSLLEQVKKNDRITLKYEKIVVDLITTDKVRPRFDQNQVLGVYVYDSKLQTIDSISASMVFLCTGGHGRVYRYTSNPETATGDGLAMAWRAGARVANLEFVQFHPTCLFHPQLKNFLISEAVRGEGGILKNQKGEAFAKLYDPKAELAPRDIVARAIDSELKASGDQFVYLDVRHLGLAKIKKLFPNIYSTCAAIDLDISEQMIPVVPAAHYSCGGVVVDSNGRTNILGLYALGEVACSGLHGANRLASNGLLEGLVFSRSVAKDALNHRERVRDQFREMDIKIPVWRELNTIAPDELGVLSHLWDEIKATMSNYVGIVRTDKRLNRALSRIVSIKYELDQFYWKYQVNQQIIEARNIAEVAHLTILCALARKESRGIHYTLDYPNRDEIAKDTIIR